MKDKYSDRRVLNICTYMTEGSRSALLSAARGLGIDSDDVTYLTGLLPNERGFVMDLKTAFFGNEEKGQKPIKELVNAVKEHEGLMETSLKIEGLIKSISSHASGVYVFNDDYTKQNAMMKTSRGQMVTQFNMKSSDYCGCLKIDQLSIKTLDKIRIAMDFLIDLGILEDKGSLKANYDEYLHPDKLVYEDSEMWDKVANNDVIDLFQFDTDVGLQCAKKTKPQSIEELSTINSLMRLMSDGEEQPIDKYVRHKNNTEEWYQEMRDYGLTEYDIKIMEKQVGQTYGICADQESLMEMVMNEDIGSFNLTEANYARKLIAKKQMSEIPKLKELLLEKGMSENDNQ